MGHSGTSSAVFNQIVDFARSIGMIALPIYKEQPGYILNSLLVPFLSAGMALYVNGVADAHTIDKTWMVAMKVPQGPMAIYDLVGINTAYHIAEMAAAAGNEQAKKNSRVLKEEFVDKGKLGISTGEGFYKYPNPAYESPDFLK